MTARSPDPLSGRPLVGYLLGRLDVPAADALQRRLGYDVSGGGPPAVVLCDHPPGVTVGRDGSRAHVRPDPDELADRGWAVRWVARGGGAMLHLPGQVACYPVLPWEPLGLTPAGYVAALVDMAAELVAGFGAAAEPDRANPGVRVRGRRVAHVGAAVRGGATAFGLVVNVCPDLAPFRRIACDGDAAPMTSLQRECPTPVRPPAVRLRLLDLIAARFGCDRVTPAHTHPTLLPKPTRHALAPGRR